MSESTIMRMMRAACPVLALLCLDACGGGSTPSSPTPPASTPPAAHTWSLAGSVVDAVSGTAIPGATLTFTTVNQTQTTGADGGWTLAGTGTAAARQAVTVTASGYQTYETGVRWDQVCRR